MRITTALVTFLATATLSLTAGAQSLPYTAGDDHLMVTPDQLEWGPVGSMAEGAEMAVIEGDLSQEEPFTFRLRLPDGYRIDPHVHPAYERLTVLSGTLHFAHGESFDADQLQRLPAGSVAIMPPGHAMFGEAEGETVFQLHGTGPWAIDYIDPAHDPRR